jgi:hypothetical protein
MYPTSTLYLYVDITDEIYLHGSYKVHKEFMYQDRLEVHDVHVNSLIVEAQM